MASEFPIFSYNLLTPILSTSTEWRTQLQPSVVDSEAVLAHEVDVAVLKAVSGAFIS
jgi:hypothetical protein